MGSFSAQTNTSSPPSSVPLISILPNSTFVLAGAQNSDSPASTRCEGTTVTREVTSVPHRSADLTSDTSTSTSSLMFHTISDVDSGPVPSITVTIGLSNSSAPMTLSMPMSMPTNTRLIGTVVPITTIYSTFVVQLNATSTASTVPVSAGTRNSEPQLWGGGGSSGSMSCAVMLVAVISLILV
ncbi:hypothetical protein BX600DRAFT_456057 [Xylariales sp. PMI_506]|nr:hypothetical protein BX600DRAFT_456057 [Xylariales sp. PMI_506]